MIQKLPARGFTWEKKVDDFTCRSAGEKKTKNRQRYILEVDAEYPKEMQKKHNELPFLAKRIKIGKMEKRKDKKQYKILKTRNSCKE